MEKNIIAKIVALFSNETEETPTFSDIKTIDGKILRVSELAFEGTVIEITEDGEVALEDGKYQIEDNKSIVAKDGVITEVLEEEIVGDEIVEDEFVMVETDNGIKLSIEGELAVDAKVSVVGEEGEMSDAPEGEYALAGDDNRIIVVDAESKIVEIKEEEAESEEEDEVQEDEMESKLYKALEEMVSKFDSVEAKLVELENENKELKEEVSKFGKAPSVAPTNTKVEFTKSDKQSKLEFFSKK